jgi:TatD DNase family protein
VTEGPTRARPGSDRTRDVTFPEPPAPLPVAVADSHCHLDIRDGDVWLEVDEALARARAVGVNRIVQVGCDLPGAQWAVECAERVDGIVAAVALHPNEAPRLAVQGRDVLEAAWDRIEQLASSPAVRAVGESGLDYFRTGDDGRAVQHESFRRHIDLARRLDKPLVIHDRDAHDDVLAVLDDAGAPREVVMHCFSGDAVFAQACLDRGFHLSFAGVVTFKNAEPLREALAVTPLDRLLVETDAPYLTPTPFRGRPNASYLIPLTVRRMAEVLDRDVAEVAAAISANSDRLFGPWSASRPA